MDLIDQDHALQEALNRFEAARIALEADKQPDRSVVAKLYDAIVETDVEEGFAAARDHLAHLEEKLLVLTPHAIVSRLQQEIAAAHTPEATRLQSLRPAVLLAGTRAATAAHLQRLATIATTELDDAVAQCGRASSGELEVAMSSLPLSREFAERESRDAFHAVNKARAALSRLGEEMEHIQASVAEDPEREWWKELDELRIPEFSGSAIATLDRAQEHCRQAAGQSRLLQTALARIANEQDMAWERSLAEFRTLEAPFLAKVLSLVPENLMQMLERHNASTFVWDGMPRRRKLLDFESLDRARA